jgi:pimeloyl-ACP methyl ester carboxylesterase
MEVTAEPGRLIAILAKATRDGDTLVRDLAATALARVYPEHSALRRLAPRARRRPSKRDAHTSLLIHGTFAKSDAWWQPGGDFHTYLIQNPLPDLYAGSDRFDWSGGYSDAARLIAASDLQQWIGSHGVSDPLVMGHSHGANVVFLTTQLGVSMREAVLLSCPVHWPKYAPDFSRVAKLVSIRVHLDLVILADGGRQRFTDPRIEEHVLPVWFNHAATHDPLIWQAHNVSAML